LIDLIQQLVSSNISTQQDLPSNEDLAYSILDEIEKNVKDLG
jgi:hypothetical protein